MVIGMLLKCSFDKFPTRMILQIFGKIKK